jgi:hypothetical protein
MSPYRAEAILKTRYGAYEKIADLYDDDEELQSALHALFPEFEYPDFSYLTIWQVLQRYQESLAG